MLVLDSVLHTQKQVLVFFTIGDGWCGIQGGELFYVKNMFQQQNCQKKQMKKGEKERENTQPINFTAPKIPNPKYTTSNPI